MKLGPIEFRHLRYFTAVVESKSFRAAAQHLHVSQPPLTRQIQQLEELLGVQLLVRQARGVELTAAGAVFYEEARNLLLLAEQAVDRTQTAAQGRLGRLDVGTFGSAVLDVIPRLIHDFLELYPKVDVVLHSLDRAGQIKALRERRITVAFNRFFETEPGLHWEAVLTERVHVAVHARHPLARRDSLGLIELANEPLIMYPRAPRPGFIDHVLRLFHAVGTVPRAAQEVDDVVSAVALVSGGVGLTLVVDSACNLRLPNVVYVPLREADRATFELCMIHRADDDSALLQAFIGVVHRLRRQRQS
ncbi:MAG: LysR family transcriptional regulator [Nevskia sp.]